MLRILLKISGEYLGGVKKFGFDTDAIDSLINQITTIYNKNIQISIVLGGGNFFRGQKEQNIINRRAGDNIGMLATVMNGLFLQSALERQNIKTRLMTAIAINQIAEPYIPRKAIRHLEKNRIIILAAGLGLPHFSTDTASVVRAKELDTDIVIKCTKVDGVYDKDPIKFINAKKFTHITYDKIIEKKIEIMDSTAITFAKEQQLPLYVLNITTKKELINFFEKKYTGTAIHLQGRKDMIENTLKKINT